MTFKRILDIVASILGLLVLSPLLIWLYVIVRRKLGTPVFFTQERPGLHCRPFRLVKFRTMTDARDAAGNLLPDAERLTPFGRWLRSSSLDELPELWNVLKGDMSLVGPRPLLPEYLNYYTEEETLRHSVRPGITGLAQVNGRNMTTWDDRLAFDVEYVRTKTLALDLWILYQTVIKVVRRDGVVVAPSTSYQKLSEERAK
jgi:sugar transferase EpsL